MRSEIQPPESNYPRERVVTLAQALEFRDGYWGAHRVVFCGFAVTALLSLVLFVFDSALAMGIVGACSILGFAQIFRRGYRRFSILDRVTREKEGSMVHVVFGVMGVFGFVNQDYIFGLGMWALAHLWLQLVAWQTLHGMGVPQRVLFGKRDAVEALVQPIGSHEWRS